ncbi:MAG TPA: hypothetical protein VGK23_09455 [Methanomassiliicoccales archaeon]|jgi:hypothetical protein
MIWNMTVAANTSRSGMTTASIVANILFDLIEDALMSSRDDNRLTRRIAINAPPTPPLRIPVMVIALDAVLTAAVVAMTKLILDNETIGDI